MSEPLTIEQILAQAENPAYVRVKTVKILLRQDLASAVDEMEAALKRAIQEDVTQNREAQAPGLAVELEAFQESLESEKVPFKFRSIGHRGWADLLAKHPPLAKHGKLDHNPETFPIAAVAASAAEPAMSEDEVARLDKSLNDTQFQILWKATLDVNMGLESPKSTTAGLILRAKGRSDVQQHDTESLDQSS